MNGITNATVSVKEFKEEIIFLYEVVLGFADRSYGIQVAKLAGMPRSVLMRANQVLSALNSTDQKNTPNTIKTLETFNPKQHT